MIRSRPTEKPSGATVATQANAHIIHVAMVNITTSFYGPELAMFALTEVLELALLIVASVQLHLLRVQRTWSLLRYFMLLLVIICICT